MRRILVVLGAAAVACGTTVANKTDAGGGGGGVADAAQRDAAGSSGSGGVVDTVNCQTHTTVVVGSDGTRTETDRNFALIDGIDPSSRFTVESCDYIISSNGSASEVYVPTDGACPSGDTCTTTGAPLPTPAHVCIWADSGEFFDGKLYVTCGVATRVYNSSGVLTGSSSSAFAVIRVHH